MKKELSLVEICKINNAIDLCCEIASNFFGIKITREMLSSKSRKHEFVATRQLIVAIIDDHCDISLKDLGGLFGGRDHTTAIHSIRTYRNMMETGDEEYVKLNSLMRYAVDHGIKKETIVISMPYFTDSAKLMKVLNKKYGIIGTNQQAVNY